MTDNDDYYPGSKQRRRDPGPAPVDAPATLGRPRILRHKGADTEFYTTGALAAAVGRSVQTIRRWERDGFIPKPTFRIGQKEGKRRLYTRAQIEGLARIAEEEGLLGHGRGFLIWDTKFRERAVALFEELKET